MSGNASTYVPGNGYAGTASSGGAPSGVIPTPIESIEEFKVGTANQTADFNGAAGSQVQMVTKRGRISSMERYTNTISEMTLARRISGRNNHTPDYATRTGDYTPLPASHRNRFGGALGGPLTPKFWGGKTYFFTNYEGYRFPNTTTFDKSVPTPLLRRRVMPGAERGGSVRAVQSESIYVTVNGVTYPTAQCSGGPGRAIRGESA